jgi:hypothetical protein
MSALNASRTARAARVGSTRSDVVVPVLPVAKVAAGGREVRAARIPSEFPLGPHWNTSRQPIGLLQGAAGQKCLSRGQADLAMAGVQLAATSSRPCRPAGRMIAGLASERVASGFCSSANELGGRLVVADSSPSRRLSALMLRPPQAPWRPLSPSHPLWRPAISRALARLLCPCAARPRLMVRLALPPHPCCEHCAPHDGVAVLPGSARL